VTISSLLNKRPHFHSEGYRTKKGGRGVVIAKKKSGSSAKKTMRCSRVRGKKEKEKKQQQTEKKDLRRPSEEGLTPFLYANVLCLCGRRGKGKRRKGSATQRWGGKGKGRAGSPGKEGSVFDNRRKKAIAFSAAKRRKRGERGVAYLFLSCWGGKEGGYLSRHHHPPETRSFFVCCRTKKGGGGGGGGGVGGRGGGGGGFSPLLLCNQRYFHLMRQEGKGKGEHCSWGGGGDSAVGSEGKRPFLVS